MRAGAPGSWAGGPARVADAGTGGDASAAGGLARAGLAGVGAGLAAAAEPELRRRLRAVSRPGQPAEPRRIVGGLSALGPGRVNN